MLSVFNVAINALHSPHLAGLRPYQPSWHCSTERLRIVIRLTKFLASYPAPVIISATNPLQSCLKWPITLAPSSRRKRLVPYLFCWSQNFTGILLILHLTRVHPVLHQIRASMAHSSGNTRNAPVRLSDAHSYHSSVSASPAYSSFSGGSRNLFSNSAVGDAYGSETSSVDVEMFGGGKSSSERGRAYGESASATGSGGATGFAQGSDFEVQLEQSIGLMLDWIRDLKGTDPIADWCWRILDGVYHLEEKGSGRGQGQEQGGRAGGASGGQ